MDELVVYVKVSDQKKSHVVSDAIREYLVRRKQQKLIDEAIYLMEKNPAFEDLEDTIQIISPQTPQ